jgi:hypothetical protein
MCACCSCCEERNVEAKLSSYCHRVTAAVAFIHCEGPGLQKYSRLRADLLACMLQSDVAIF